MPNVRRSKRARSTVLREVDWAVDGVKIVSCSLLSGSTRPQVEMENEPAIDLSRIGAQKLWAGRIRLHPGVKTSAHHHGKLETVFYVLSGRAFMRWGDRLEHAAEARPGDFIYIPPFVPHQEINPSPDEPLDCILVRSDSYEVVVDIEPPAR